ncbi:MAG: hypothetical protein ABH835_05095 [Patescibacteria group bacterium]|nr:hypothetical protein [Patescibacteria group bacterium]
MTKKTETVLLAMLAVAVIGGVSYEFYQLNKRGYLKEGSEKAKSGIEEFRDSQEDKDK